MPALRLIVSTLLASLALVACDRTEQPTATVPPPPPVASPAPATMPFKVNTIELGKAIDEDKRITAPSSSFAPNDTIYASVATVGASPSVTLVARWTYQDGQIVKEESQVIAPDGADSTEFHIEKPDGWPAGSYQLEVIANGASAGKRAFQVQ